MSENTAFSHTNMGICPRCGKDLSQPQLRVSEETVKDYVRHMLGGRRFKKEFEMFDGALKITFEEPTAGEDWKKQTSGDSTELARDKYMLLTLAAVETVDKEVGVTKALYKKSPNERLELINNVPEGIANLSESLSTVQLAIVSRCSTTFAALLSLIISEVTSEDFYKGAGLL